MSFAVSARYQPAILVEDERIRVIYDRPARFRNQPLFEFSPARDTVKRTRRAFEIAGVTRRVTVAPGRASLFEFDTEITGCEAGASGFVDQVKILGLDLDSLIRDSFFETRPGLLPIPEYLRWAIFKDILFVVFDPDDAIGQNRKTDTGNTDNSAGICSRLEGWNRRKRHDFLDFNGVE